MAEVDDVVARLRAEAELAGRGGFSVDRARARAKMREFQLADPRRWVLLLVRAAIMRGARHIEVGLGARGFTVRFDGPALERVDFEELYTSMFASAASPEVLARRELALALNAAMALRPRRLRVTSGDGISTIALELAVDREDEITVPEKPVTGTLVEVEDRLGVAVLERLRQETRPESALLREGCRWSDRDVRLDGARISMGLGQLAVRGATRIEAPWTGRCGFAEGPAPATITVLQHGIVLSEHEAPALPRGFVAVVDGSSLRTDISRNQPVRDRAYEALLEALAEAADRALGSVARTHGTAIPAPWLAELMLARLHRHGALDPAAMGETVGAIAELPLWRRLDGARVSSVALVRGPATTYATEAPGIADMPAELQGVVRVELDEVATLRRIDPRAVDRTAAVVAAAERARHRLAARARPHAVALPEGSWVVAHEIVRDGVRVVLGLPAAAASRPRVQLVSSGYLLCEVEPEIGLPFVAVVAAGLAPGAHGELPLADAALARALDVLGDGIEALVERLAVALGDDPALARDHTGRLRAALCDHLWVWLTGELDARLHAACGSVAATARAAVGLAPRATPRAADPEGHRVFGLPLVDTVERGADGTAGAGGRISIAEICADEGLPIARHGDLRVRLDAPRVVVADATAWRVLALLCHPTRLAGVEGGDREDRERARFLARPQVWSVRREPMAIGPIDVDRDGLRCSLGVLASLAGERPPAGLRVRIVREQRMLADLRWPAPIAALDAVIGCDDVAVNHDWTGLADETARDRVLAAIAAALEVAVGLALDGDGVEPGRVRLLAAAACASEQHAAATRGAPLDPRVAGLCAACARHDGRLRALPAFAGGRSLANLLAGDAAPVPLAWWERQLLRSVLDTERMARITHRAPTPEPTPLAADSDDDEPIPFDPTALGVAATIAAPTTGAPPADRSAPLDVETPPQPSSAPPAAATAPGAAVPPEPDPTPAEPAPRDVDPRTDAAPVPRADATPAERLLQGVLAVLRAVRGADPTWAGDIRLERLRIEVLEDFVVALVRDDHVVVNRLHPVVVEAIASDPTPSLHAHIIASAVFTAVNQWSDAVLDRDESAFIAAQVRCARSRLAQQ